MRGVRRDVGAHRAFHRIVALSLQSFDGSFHLRHRGPGVPLPAPGHFEVQRRISRGGGPYVPGLTSGEAGESGHPRRRRGGWRAHSCVGTLGTRGVPSRRMMSPRCVVHAVVSRRGRDRPCRLLGVEPALPRELFGRGVSAATGDGGLHVGKVVVHGRFGDLRDGRERVGQVGHDVMMLPGSVASRRVSLLYGGWIALGGEEVPRGHHVVGGGVLRELRRVAHGERGRAR